MQHPQLLRAQQLPCKVAPAFSVVLLANNEQGPMVPLDDAHVADNCSKGTLGDVGT